MAKITEIIAQKHDLCLRVTYIKPRFYKT